MRPGRRTLYALVAWSALALVAAWVPPALAAWWAAGAVLLAALLLEGWALRKPPALSVRRDHAAAFSLGEWHEVRVRLENSGPRTLSIRVYDHHPPQAEVEGLPRRLVVAPGRFVELPWRLRPTERGAAAFGAVAVLTDGPLRLLVRHDLLGEPAVVRVYPSFRRVASTALLALGRRAGQMGIHLRRRRGQGLEFHQLREYREGDTMRQVDWKSVSRRQQLISREYREEQNQRVVFLLDCGRRMHTRDGEVRLFDRALDAMLLLSFVALRQGDAVGVIAFSGAERWLPPVRGRSAMRALLNTVYDLRTTTAPSDYAEAAHHLGTRQHRRSLVVLLTNLRDDDSADLAEVLAPLRRRHLVLVASLRDPALRRTDDDPVEKFDEAVGLAALDAYLARRREAVGALRGRGVQAIDVEPADLPAALVNRYLEIKRAGRL